MKAPSSPLADQFVQLCVLFGGVGILAAVFVDPGMICPVAAGLLIIRRFYVYLETPDPPPPRHHRGRHRH